MDGEDEVDILGDFSLEELLTKGDARMSCYDGGLTCDYSNVSSQWLLDTSTQSVWYPEPHPEQAPAQEPPALDAHGWSDKEKYLLDKGLELFGQSWPRLSQYIGTKTAHQVKSYVRSGCALSSDAFSAVPVPIDASDYFANAEGDDAGIPASMEEVITVVSTAKPTVRSAARGRQSKSGEGRKRGAKATVDGGPAKEEQDAEGGGGPDCRFKHREGKSRGRPRGGRNVNVIKARATRQYGGDIGITVHHGGDSTTSVHHGIHEQIVRITKAEELSDDSEIDVEDDCSPVAGPPPPEPEPPEPRPPPPPSGHSAVNRERLNEVYKLGRPEAESVVRGESVEVSSVEMELLPEFFSAAKYAPSMRARYLKIRAHVLECWRQTRPAYVTKTSIRAGLKNCGDVNLLGRVHAYLEQIGAINFGCEQCRYNCETNSSSDGAETKRESRANEVVGESAPRVSATRVRKKRLMSPAMSNGDGGFTMMHGDNGAVTVTHMATGSDTESRPRQSRPKKAERIKLIPCKDFTAEFPAPYAVSMELGALLLADLHAHSSPYSEVMGLLGGSYDGSLLRVTAAVPCRASSSDSVQCDMCPVSEWEGAGRLESQGLRVLGWYHSHPGRGNRCDPSQQDLATQLCLQRYFSRSTGAPFTALIFSPYSVDLPKYKYFTLLETGGASTPYRLECRVSAHDFDARTVLCALKEAMAVSNVPPSPLDAFTDQCVQNVSKHVESAKPKVDADAEEGLYESIRRLFLDVPSRQSSIFDL